MKALIICGPTASGKSQLGHIFAQENNGEIVNIDSMQIYKDIPIITASPSNEFREQLPYHLYNFLEIDQEFSVIKYLQLASEKIREITLRGKLPIIIGGTGLYINSLVYGYNHIPQVPDDIRSYTRNLYNKLGIIEFFKQLTQLDPLVINKLNPEDTQRILRAYEVFAYTNKSIFDFQTSEKFKSLPEFKFKIIFLHPQRDFLYKKCNERLDKIFQEEAIEEIYLLQKKFPNVKNIRIKALGVQEILSYLNGEINLNIALDLTKNKTRQYSKRQITWFKNQIKDKVVLEYSNEKELEILWSHYKQSKSFFTWDLLY